MNFDYRKTLVVGGTAVAIIGLGGTALAATGSDAVSGSSVHQAAAPSGTAKAGHGKHDGKHAGKHNPLRRVEHAQIVTHGKKGTVTRTLWRGTVSSVSSSTLTVKAADGKSQAYTVNKDTKFRERAKGKKPVASSLSKIAKGDSVFVSGTGTSTVTAKQVVELPKK